MWHFDFASFGLGVAAVVAIEGLVLAYMLKRGYIVPQ